jgi:hypothetical protein
MQKTNLNLISIFLIVFFTLGTCYADNVTIDSGYCANEKIKDSNLLVISPDNNSEPIWFNVSKWRISVLKNPPPTLHDVLTLKASNDNKYLAILSVGEGHPVIDIFLVSDVLSDLKPSFSYSLDPYPGDVTIVEWNAHALHVKSDILLTHRINDGRVPGALMLFSPESFMLDVETGKIEPISESLKDPIAYYGNHLLETPDEYSPVTELSAMDVLNGKEAIPYLQTALKRKRYIKYQADIIEVIERLKKSYNKPNSADAKSSAAD